MAEDQYKRADMRPCKGCVYLGWASGLWCCDYLLREKHPRGCPAGAGCIWKRTRTVLKEEGKS